MCRFFVSVRLCLAFSGVSRVYKSDLYIEPPSRHYSVYKSGSDIGNSTAALLSGTQSTMPADMDLKSAENLWSGLNLSKITIPASLTVTNGTADALEVLISSDHSEDQIGEGSQQQISLPAGSLDQIDYTINVTPAELNAGKLERRVTASSDDGSVSDTQHLSMSLYSGGWKPETGFDQGILACIRAMTPFILRL